MARACSRSSRCWSRRDCRRCRRSPPRRHGPPPHSASAIADGLRRDCVPISCSSMETPRLRSPIFAVSWTSGRRAFGSIAPRTPRASGGKGSARLRPRFRRSSATSTRDRVPPSATAGCRARIRCAAAILGSAGRRSAAARGTAPPRCGSRAEVAAGVGEPWGGAIFFPAGSPNVPADPARRKRIPLLRKRRRWLAYRVRITSRTLGQTSPERTFRAGAEWQLQTFAWSEFGGSDGSDVTRILIAAGPSPRQELLIDQFEIR